MISGLVVLFGYQSFAAFTWHYTVWNLISSSVLSVKLMAAVGAPPISGLENYAWVPSDPSTVPPTFN